MPVVADIPYRSFSLEITFLCVISCHSHTYLMLIFSDFAADQGLINYIETKAKCCHLKKLTCKGTLQQVFIIVYRLEKHFCHELVFLTQLCKLSTL